MFGLTKNTFTWPYLERLLASGYLPYLDYALAERLLSSYPECEESVAAFICHLSLATRAGHLCISIENEQIFPDPRSLWLENRGENKDLSQTASSTSTQFEIQELDPLVSLIAEGASKLPTLLVTDVVNPCKPITPICKFNTLFYFQRYWYYETLFVENFKKIENSIPAFSIDPELISQQLINLQKNGKLLPEQALAILSACQNGFSIICGGPGTGKTYTAGQLIKIIWMSMSSEQRRDCVIVLAAPTGKAAANLQKSLNAAVSGLEGFSGIKAKTLHSLLGMRSSSTSKNITQLSADLILIDESSMIDVRLMAHLLSAVKPGARLLLLGDRHQLPSVEAGTLFADLIAYLTEKKEASKQVVELKTCLRAELKSITTFASAINSGNSPEVLRLLSKSEKSSEIQGIYHTHLKHKASPPILRTTQQQLIKNSLPYFRHTFDLNESPQQLLDSFNRFRILSPLRKSPLGVDALNDLFFHQLLKKNGKNTQFIAPIMLVSNNYRLELFNGEVGVLVRQGRRQNDETLQEGDYALFPNKNEGEESVRKLPAILLPQYEYAYCLSVHKSQGSEFDHILLVMPDGSELFGREVLYTAVTRARKKLELWSSEEILTETISKRSVRLSGVNIRLKL